jgi:hypothetical protein
VTSQHEPAPVHSYYAADHCALNWRLLAAGLGAPVAVIALFIVTLATPLSRAWVGPLLGIVALTGVWTVCGQMLPYVWPVGIRLDTWQPGDSMYGWP